MSPHRRLTCTAAAFLVGVWIGSYALEKIPLSLVGFVGAGWLSLSIQKFRKWWALWLVLGLISGYMYIRTWRYSHFVEYGTEKIAFTGVVVQDPDNRIDRSFLTITPDAPIGLSKYGRPAEGRILVKTDRYPVIVYGDHLKIEGVIEKAEPFNGFNYPLYLEKSGIYGVMNRSKVYIVEHNKGDPVTQRLLLLRQSWERLMQRDIPEPEASFLAGVLLGSKRAIPEYIQEALKYTGTSHMVAISGANITIMLSLLLNVLPLYSRWHQFWATVVIAVFITILTGASASVVRGAYVAIIGSLLRALGRRSWTTPFIVFSATLMISRNPLLLVADPGFQLSFAAYAGLLYWGTGIKNRIDRGKLTKKLPEIMRGSLAETLAATLGTIPLSFKMFGQISLLSLVVNPLVLWLLPAITLLGLLYIATGWVHIFSLFLSFPLAILLRTSLSIIRVFATIPIGVIHWPSAPP